MILLAGLLLAGSFTMVSGQSRARYKVAGLVVERGLGEPVVMASVVIKELGLWAVTDADGHFEIAGVPAGRHELEFALLGYETLKLPVEVKGDLLNLGVELAISSLSLDAVVVTAKEGGEITTASKITKQTLEHIQPSSLTDVMQLLPGSVTENPTLTQVGALSIRDIGTNTANAAGTALIVDGPGIDRQHRERGSHPRHSVGGLRRPDLGCRRGQDQGGRHSLGNPPQG